MLCGLAIHLIIITFLFLIVLDFQVCAIEPCQLRNRFFRKDSEPGASAVATHQTLFERAKLEAVHGS